MGFCVCIQSIIDALTKEDKEASGSIRNLLIFTKTRDIHLFHLMVDLIASISGYSEASLDVLIAIRDDHDDDEFLVRMI